MLILVGLCKSTTITNIVFKETLVCIFLEGVGKMKCDYNKSLEMKVYNFASKRRDIFKANMGLDN